MADAGPEGCTHGTQRHVSELSETAEGLSRRSEKRPDSPRTTVTLSQRGVFGSSSKPGKTMASQPTPSLRSEPPLGEAVSCLLNKKDDGCPLAEPAPQLSSTGEGIPREDRAKAYGPAPVSPPPDPPRYPLSWDDPGYESDCEVCGHDMCPGGVHCIGRHPDDEKLENVDAETSGEAAIRREEAANRQTDQLIDGLLEAEEAKSQTAVPASPPPATAARVAKKKSLMMSSSYRPHCSDPHCQCPAPSDTGMCEKNARLTNLVLCGRSPDPPAFNVGICLSACGLQNRAFISHSPNTPRSHVNIDLGGAGGSRR